MRRNTQSCWRSSIVTLIRRRSRCCRNRVLIETHDHRRTTNNSNNSSSSRITTRRRPASLIARRRRRPRWSVIQAHHRAMILLHHAAMMRHRRPLLSPLPIDCCKWIIRCLSHLQVPCVNQICILNVHFCALPPPSHPYINIYFCFLMFFLEILSLFFFCWVIMIDVYLLCYNMFQSLFVNCHINSFFQRFNN